jgi:hypothetical protein
VIGPRLRIITGPVAVVEHQLNELLDEYAVTVWQFTPIKDEMHITAILIAVSELRKGQLANLNMNPGQRPI